jgi:hypothetical protein
MLAALSKQAPFGKRTLLLYHLIAIATVLIGGYYLQWQTFIPNSEDFFGIIWTPGQYMIRGEPPPLSYPYPLWTPALLLPYSYLPAEVGVQYWVLTNLALLTVVTLLVSYLLGWERYLFLSPAASLLLIVFYPVYIGILAGQIVFLVSLWLMLLIWALREQHWGRVGTLLALTLMKPQLIILVTLMVLGTALWQRRWRVFIGFAAVLAVLILVALPFASTPRQIFGGGVGDHLITYLAYGSTLWGLSLKLLPEVLLVPLILSVLLVGWVTYLWVRALRSGTLNQQLYGLIAITTTVNLLVMPYGWSYNQVVLIFAICYAASSAWELAGLRRLGYLAALFTIALVVPPVVYNALVGPDHLDVYHAIMPLLLLPILVLLERERRRLPQRALPA